MSLALVVLLGCQLADADRLWVENPDEIAFSVAGMTPVARDMGLTNAGLTATLRAALKHAGLKARPSNLKRDRDVLFLDVIVEGETYYASLEFWRMASYPLPNGEASSEFVTVWQDYSVGAHHNDPAPIRGTVGQIIDRFIAEYSAVNNAGTSPRVMSNP